MVAALSAIDERDRPLSADRVPTLTEVVEFATEPAPPVALVEAPLGEAPALPEGPVLPATAVIDPQALVQQVLAELAPRIDLLLEARLREALAPALARAADSLIRDSRQELHGTLHDLVREAVARVLQRHGQG